MLEIKTKAPGFTVKDQDGNNISLDDFAGKKVILYFYPKDNTPGCTKEACNFRDYYEEIKKLGTVILGVSADSGESHRKFISKYKLPFTLLSDPERKLIDLYEAWGEKKMYGKLFKGIIRSTVIIDENGFIEKVFPKVKASEHGKEIYEYLRSVK